jgi:hypothetical protein
MILNKVSWPGMNKNCCLTCTRFRLNPLAPNPEFGAWCSYHLERIPVTATVCPDYQKGEVIDLVQCVGCAHYKTINRYVLFGECTGTPHDSHTGQLPELMHACQDFKPKGRARG